MFYNFSHVTSTTFLDIRSKYDVSKRSLFYSSNLFYAYIGKAVSSFSHISHYLHL